MATRLIPNTELLTDDSIERLIGDSGGVSTITGEVARSNVVSGCILVETEHGTLYLDEDGDSLVE